MKKIILALVLTVAIPLSVAAQDHPHRRVECTVEIMPNYIMHLFVVADIWDNGGGEYAGAFGHTVNAADAAYLHGNREWIAWGESRVGTLSVPLFFFPFRSPVSLESYCDILENTLSYARAQDWQGMAEYYGEGNADSFRLAPGVEFSAYEIDVIEEMLRIVQENYPVYMKTVWPEILPPLDRGKQYIEAAFQEDPDVFGIWEEALGLQPVLGSFVPVLTYANGVSRAPSANNLSAERNNFGYGPATDTDYIKTLIIHEIGIYNIFPVIIELYREPGRLSQVLKDGDNTIYYAVESYIETRMEELFGTRVPGFESGWERDYEWFREYYRRINDPGRPVAEIIREAVWDYYR